MHAHAHGEVGDAVQAPRRSGLFAPALQDGQAGTHRALGIVVARIVHAEGRLETVAGEAQHAALVRFDKGGHTLQRSAEHRQRVLGVHALRHGGGAHHVGKQHRHLAVLQAGGPRQAGEAGQAGLARAAARWPVPARLRPAWRAGFRVPRWRFRAVLAGDS